MVFKKCHSVRRHQIFNTVSMQRSKILSGTRAEPDSDIYCEQDLDRSRITNIWTRNGLRVSNLDSVELWLVNHFSRIKVASKVSNSDHLCPALLQE